MKLYLAPPDHGLADIVLILPVVQQLIDQQHEVYIVAKSHDQLELAKKVTGITGALTDWEFVHRPPEGAYRLYDFQKHRLYQSYCLSSLETWDGQFITGDEIVAKIASDFRLNVEINTWRPMEFTTIPEVQGKVVLAPGTNADFKCWPSHYWLELAHLLEEDGLEPVMIGSPGRSPACRALIAMGIGWLPTTTVAEAIDVISSAHIAIGVENGYTHLAVHQLKPVVSIHRKSPVHLRRYPNVFPVIDSKRCNIACYDLESSISARACEERAQLSEMGWSDMYKPSAKNISWACRAAIGSGCMDRLTPDRVYEAVRCAQLYACGQLSLPIMR